MHELLKRRFGSMTQTISKSKQIQMNMRNILQKSTITKAHLIFLCESHVTHLEERGTESGNEVRHGYEKQIRSADRTLCLPRSDYASNILALWSDKLSLGRWIATSAKSTERSFVNELKLHIGIEFQFRLLTV